MYSEKNLELRKIYLRQALIPDRTGKTHIWLIQVLFKR